MEKKKFKVTVHRTDTFEIEIDPEVINDEWIKFFESYMWDIDEDSPYEDLAKHIGQMCARFGHRCFMEGFGIIPAEGEYFTENEKESFADGFKLKVVSEDDEIEIDAREI